MKVLILGVGGLGGFFGAHLQKTNCDVTLKPKTRTYEPKEWIRPRPYAYP